MRMGKKRPGQKKRIASERKIVLDVMVREGARDASETTEEIGVMRGASTAGTIGVTIGASTAVMIDMTTGALTAGTTDVTTGALTAVTTDAMTGALIAVTTDAIATEMKEVMKGTPTGVTEATVKDGEREATDSQKLVTMASPEETAADTAM